MLSQKNNVHKWTKWTEANQFLYVNYKKKHGGSFSCGSGKRKPRHPTLSQCQDDEGAPYWKIDENSKDSHSDLLSTKSTIFPNHLWNHRVKPQAPSAQVRKYEDKSMDLKRVEALKTIPKIWVFPKIRGTPKSSILIGFSIVNHPFWGTPIFGNTHITFPQKKKTLKEIPGST